MADSPAPRLTYSLESTATAGRCRVVLHGEITLDEGQQLLERLWTDPPYLASDTAIWDVGGCELPDFDDLVSTARYINKHKNGRGPAVVAFVSPAFTSSALARAFRGFDRIISLDLNFFGDDRAADDWLDKRHSEAP